MHEDPSKRRTVSIIQSGGIEVAEYGTEMWARWSLDLRIESGALITTFPISRKGLGQ